ncbi:MAG: ATPase, T2SS/T4P/T4SS family [Candidatus Eremiobacterota bacterium]
MSDFLNKDMGDLLIEEKLISPEQLERALEKQKNNKNKLEEILISLGYVTEKDITKTLGKSISVPFIDLDEEKLDEEMVLAIPEHLAVRYRVIPVRITEKEEKFRITGETIKKLPDEISINKLRRLINESFLRTELKYRLKELNYEEKEIETIISHALVLKGEILLLAMADPLNVFAIDDIRLITGFDIEPLIATEKSILKAINIHFGITEYEEDSDINDFVSEEPEGKEENIELKRLKKLARKESIVKTVNLIISQAIQDKAGAIYIEPAEEEMTVFYKIDGILHKIMNIPKDQQESVINRIKLIAKLDILEKNLSRKGSFTLIQASEEYGLTVYTSPVTEGEKISITILYKEMAIDHDKSGFKGERKLIFQDLLLKEPGMMLITGPSESGKSTTLYTALHMLEGSDKTICVIGDYIYSLRHITEIELNPLKGFTLQEALKNIIHQDNDIIIVEDNIPEKETLELAFKTALKKNLVLTATLPGCNTVSVIKGLYNMSIDPFLLSALKGIITQRLVPLICPHCREIYTPSDEEVAKFGSNADNPVFYRGRGCDECKGTGYKGRSPIFEIMSVDDHLRSRILKKATDSEIKEVSIKNGMTPMEEELKDLVLQGNTTIEEFLKIM